MTTSYHDHATRKHPETNDPGLAVVPAGILDLKRDAPEHHPGILKIQSSICQGLRSLGRIAGYAHLIIVVTSIS
jgi:hypothetical protein